jgi:DNA polymerase-3 subunit alpha
MGKKIQTEMDDQRKIFVQGSVSRNVPEQKASDIFDQVAKFAGYGFNKSHAAAYGLVAYQTAYLKANFPVEFMAASMTLDIQNTDKLYLFKQELERLNIDLLPPNINKSDATFKVEYNGKGGAVRYALAAIKNVGEAAMSAVMVERKSNGDFKSLDDFANRLDTKVINKRQLENLIRSGGLDELNSNRKQMVQGIVTIVGHASAAQQDRLSAQIGLFGAEEDVVATVTLPITKDWLESDRLKEEFSAIGFHLSAHPLDSYVQALERLKIISYAKVEASRLSGPVKIAGLVISKKERISAKGNKYAFIQLSDASGSFEVTVFSDVLISSRDLLEPGSKVIVVGSADFKDQLKILANRIISLDDAATKTSAGLKIYTNNTNALSNIKTILNFESSLGKGNVSIVSIINMREITMAIPGKFSVSPGMAQALKAVSGVDDVREI